MRCLIALLVLRALQSQVSGHRVENAAIRTLTAEELDEFVQRAQQPLVSKLLFEEGLAPQLGSTDLGRKLAASAIEDSAEPIGDDDEEHGLSEFKDMEAVHNAARLGEIGVMNMSFNASEQQESGPTTQHLPNASYLEDLPKALENATLDVRGYMCLQLEIDLSVVAMPGLGLSLGLQGGVHRSKEDDCWGMSLEFLASLSWGFRVLGFNVGVSIDFVGSIDADEKPAAVVLADPDAFETARTQALMYTPSHADLGRCHTKSPWHFIQVYFESTYPQLLETPFVKKHIAKLRQQVISSHYIEFYTTYARLVNDGTFEVLPARCRIDEKGRGRWPCGPAQAPPVASVLAPSLNDEALAMLSSARRFLLALPSLASEAIDRVSDNLRPSGTDGECNYDLAATACTRALGSAGRFLARWPGVGDLPDLADSRAALRIDSCGLRDAVGTWLFNGDHGGRPAYTHSERRSLVIQWSSKHKAWHLIRPDPRRKKLGVFRQQEAMYTSDMDTYNAPLTGWEAMEDAPWPIPTLVEVGGLSNVELAGVEEAKIRWDQRVLNFAKIARVSERRATPLFWRELAISAGNLFVRIVADVQALFNAVFAGDVRWDGHCQSLPISRELPEAFIEDWLLKPHAWVSSSFDAADRVKFANRGRYNNGRSFADLLQQVPQLSSLLDMPRVTAHNHLWCALARNATLAEGDDPVADRGGGAGAKRGQGIGSETTHTDALNVTRAEGDVIDSDDEGSTRDHGEHRHTSSAPQLANDINTTFAEGGDTTPDDDLGDNAEHERQRVRSETELAKASSAALAAEVDDTAPAGDVSEQRIRSETGLAKAGNATVATEDDDTAPVDDVGASVDDETRVRSTAEVAASGATVVQGDDGNPDDSRGDNAQRERRVRAATEPVEVVLSQACHAIEVRRRGLHPEDDLQWDATAATYRVLRQGALQGYLKHPSREVLQGSIEQLHGDGALRSASAARYYVESKLVDARPECERVLLSVPFVRTFPAFVAAAQEYLGRIEDAIGEVHHCLGLTLQGEEIRARMPMCRQEARKTEAEGQVDRLEDASTLEALDELLLRHEPQDPQTSFVKGKALDVLRALRAFLLHLGAEAPDTGVDAYFEGERSAVPLSAGERQILAVDHGALVRRMAEDFVRGFGVSHDDLSTMPEKLYLTGRAWSDLPRLRDVVLARAEAGNDVMPLLPRSMSRPPMEIMSGFTFAKSTSRAVFCIARPILLEISEVTLNTRRTWSAFFQNESCQVGRIRPAQSSLQLYRCWGVTSHGEEYYDWRVRSQTVILQVGGQSLGRTQASLLQSVADYLLFYGAESFGSATTKHLIANIAPLLGNAHMLQSILLSASVALPIGMEVAGAAASSVLVHRHTFAALCMTLCNRLASNGLIDADLNPKPPPLISGSSRLDLWWSTTMRQTVHYVRPGPDGEPRGPPRLRRDNRQANAEILVVRSKRYSSAALLYMASLMGQTPQPGAIPGAITTKAKMAGHFRYDLSSFVMRWEGAKQREEHARRVERCAVCLGEGRAFCDWRPVLGALWREEDDVCVDVGSRSEASCTADLGIKAGSSEPSPRGAYFSADGLGGGEACQALRPPAEVASAAAKSSKNLLRLMDRW